MEARMSRFKNNARAITAITLATAFMIGIASFTIVKTARTRCSDMSTNFRIIRRTMTTTTTTTTNNITTIITNNTTSTSTIDITATLMTNKMMTRVGVSCGDAIRHPSATSGFDPIRQRLRANGSRIQKR